MQILIKYVRLRKTFFNQLSFSNSWVFFTVLRSKKYDPYSNILFYLKEMFVRVSTKLNSTLKYKNGAVSMD